MIQLKGRVSKVMPNGIAIITIPTDYGMDNIIEIESGKLEAGMRVIITIEPVKVKSALARLIPSTI